MVKFLITTGGRVVGTVTVTAKRLLRDAVRDSGRRSTVQMPEKFARITKSCQTSTQLSRLFVRGEVVLKLYLTLLLLTRKPPHELFRPVADQFWANLFGYEERTETHPYPGPGTRRVKRALATLRSEEGPDGPLLVQRVERGRGLVLRVVPPEGPLQAPYITLPLQLWSNGWINVMTGRALFVYVCLRLMFVSKSESNGLHISVWERERFAMGDDTWHRGVAELQSLGLVKSEISSVQADNWSTDLRKRKVYYLNHTYLMENDSPTHAH